MIEFKLWINPDGVKLNGEHFVIDEFTYRLRYSDRYEILILQRKRDATHWDTIGDAIIDNNQVVKISDPSGISGRVIIGGRRYIFKVDNIQKTNNGKHFCKVELSLPEEETNKTDQFVGKLSEASNQKDDELKVYHYTHLFNALSIIESGKIASRSALNKDGVNYNDAAGDVIDNNLKAKPYARFYFRTRTNTQFMNEYLGHDAKLRIKRGNSDKSYFYSAKKLRFPKCPFPVIFEMPLNQILSSPMNCCFYSNGNLQSKDTEIFSVYSPSYLSSNELFVNNEDFYQNAPGQAWESALEGENYDDAYEELKREYERVSQQEFLVKGELPISNLDYKILCPSDEIKQLLLFYLIDENIIAKVEVKPEYFYNENRKITVSIDDNSVSLSSNYNTDSKTRYYGTSYFVVRGDPELLLHSQKLREDENKHSAFYPSLEFTRNDKSLSVYFIDEFARAQKWLVFYQGNRPDVEQSEGLFVKHKEYEAYKSIIENFLGRINKVNINLTKDLFNRWMVNSLHGIAHTARVVFFTHMIIELSNIKEVKVENLRNACYYAAILHDIGKKGDKEDSQHGEESRNKYNSLIQSQKINQIPEDYEEQVLDAVQYHSVDDSQVPDEKKTLIWKILKDADALDRARLPIVAECERKYLRTGMFKMDESELLLKFATCVTLWTASCAFEDPYKELIDRLSLFV